MAIAARHERGTVVGLFVSNKIRTSAVWVVEQQLSPSPMRIMSEFKTSVKGEEKMCVSMGPRVRAGQTAEWFRSRTNQ